MTILLLGKNGQLGARLSQALPALDTVVAVGRAELDLTRPDDIRALIRGVKPSTIVNAAAYTAVDRAETERELAMQVNGVAPGVMAEEARRSGALLVHYSTDYVFEGTKPTPYTEDDACHPVNYYGVTKFTGEESIRTVRPDHLILRTSWVYDLRAENFVLTMLKLARERPELRVVADQTGSPTWAQALAASTLDLFRTSRLGDCSGIYHLTAEGSTSRYALAEAIVEAARAYYPAHERWARLEPASTADFPRAARRPVEVRLSTDKARRVFGITMPHWRLQLDAFMKELSVTFRTIDPNRR